MCRVRCGTKDGLVSSERVATITTADGSLEEVAVSASMIDGDVLHAALVGKESGRTLIELPLESASGKWRLWVDDGQIL